MTDIRTHPCGCSDALHGPTGARRSVSKCAFHRGHARDPATLDASYYARIGVVDAGGRLQPHGHVAELVESLGPLPPPGEPAEALEVGCGVSPYVDLIRAAGYRYRGLEPSPWAAGWMGRTYGAFVCCTTVEAMVGVDVPGGGYGLILAAHVLEHLDDAPAAVVRLAVMLAPGGEMWIVVPDDRDPVNPDHLWFLTPDSLRAIVEAAGLEVLGEARRQVASHEDYLYLRARRP